MYTLFFFYLELFYMGLITISAGPNSLPLKIISNHTALRAGVVMVFNRVGPVVLMLDGHSEICVQVLGDNIFVI